MNDLPPSEAYRQARESKVIVAAIKGALNAERQAIIRRIKNRIADRKVALTDEEAWIVGMIAERIEEVR
jgi:hypothetical protein